MMKTSPHRACPVCENSAGAELLHTQGFVLPENHPLPAKYDIVACAACGFVYADTAAGQAAYDKYYAEMSKYETNYTHSATSLFVDRASWIGGAVPDRSHAIIDIGCGNGELLSELRKLGFSALTGLDPSEKCVSGLEKRGFSGIVSSIFSISAGREYDAAVLSGVLEHICDVGAAMAAMRRLLRRGGQLFVCVPDASRYQDYDAVPWDYFNIEHINHFDEASLLNLGLRHGFKTVSSVKTTITLSKTTQPVLFHVYESAGMPPVSLPPYSRSRVAEYVARTGNNPGAARILARLAETGREIIVWGAGNYTSRLLAGGGLAGCNIALIVDNDKHKQGTTLGGHAVCPPDAVRGLKTKPAILIGAAVFCDEIAAEIRAMGLSNEVIVLK